MSASTKTSMLPTMGRSGEFNSIDEIIQQLEVVVNAIVANSRMEYFAALYHKVTLRVKEGIIKGEFEDVSRMEKFDVMFASRYLAAVKKWNHYEKPTSPWSVALKATTNIFPLVLQHLLLGMNAHINLDLSIPAVELARTSGQDIQML